MPPSRTSKSLGAALCAGRAAATTSLLLLAGAVVATSQPAQAQFAPATDCLPNSGALGTEIFVSEITQGFQCYIGDKLFSNFSFSGYLDSDRISISQAPTFHNIQSTRPGGSFDVGNYTMGYTVTVWEGLRFISGYTTGGDASLQGTEWNKTLASPPFAQTLASNTVPSPSVLRVINPPVKSAVFASAFAISTGRLNSVTDSIYQELPGTSVPGPLPIAGAGIAFAFSRKLRNRIKVAG